MKKLLSMILAVTIIVSLSQVINAKENLIKGKFEFYTPDQKISNFVSKSNSKVYDPDPYEPNNSRKTAYPYDGTSRLTGHWFIEGYRNSSIHEAGDVDYFSKILYQGTRYEVILKNIYDEDRNIYIEKVNPDGTVTTYKNPFPVPSGQPERYIFIPPSSGVYYIKIDGKGSAIGDYYFFSVEVPGTVDASLWPRK